MTPTYMKPLINQIASSLIMEDVFSGLLGGLLFICCCSNQSIVRVKCCLKCTGIAGTVVGHPMDTIKVVLLECSIKRCILAFK